jgi:LCP family protein required for cell wall assembly
VNLVSARSRSNTEARKLSRNKSADGYAQLRRKRERKKQVLLGAGITFVSLLVAGLIGVAAYIVFLNNTLGTDLRGNLHDFGSNLYAGFLQPPEKPEDPFWVLLMGTDDRNDSEIPRTDTLILARVDQSTGKAALISIPRDLYVNIPDHGWDKVNAAYVYAELRNPGSGPLETVRTVSELAGVNISYFAQVNFEGLVQLVDVLGGVEVDVPVDIIGDTDAGGLDIYAGLQRLDGEHALTFCRSRDFAASDYQRQANQRTFLQALVKQVLASDLPTIASSVTEIAKMTFTNMDIATIVKVAQGMRGMEEGAIHTYYVPSGPDPTEETTYVLLKEYEWEQMIQALEAGEFPERQEDFWAGVTPESYLPNTGTTTTDQLAGQSNGQSSNINPADYVVDTRNGYGIAGSATSVSDMLVLAGFKKGEIDNANSFVYETTLIVYNNDADKPVAENIRQRLGFGKLVSSLGQYSFSGDILVVVGGDFPVPN